MQKYFYSNGKLLLTGEYAVLDGAMSLAIPTRYGQSLSIAESNEMQLHWKSLDVHGNIWFEGTFDISSILNDTTPESYLGLSQLKIGNADTISKTLIHILREAKKMNSDFLENAYGFSVETKLDFPRNWGLGSSSTLINNIAQWAKVDAYELLWNTLSGSGYDIACAQNNSPIVYRLVKGKPIVTSTTIDLPFHNHLFFVHLNKKQNSRKGIASYRAQNFDKARLVKEVSKITEEMLFCQDLSDFNMLLSTHELLLSKILNRQTVKELLFPNFEGTIKSLGAWGGDFILASGDQETPSYFKKMGYNTVIPYSDMALNA